MTKLIKRMLDLTAAFCLLVLLCPLMLLIAIAVCCESPGGPFFRQKRAGRNGREFFVIKFRSMRPGPLGPTSIRDPRTTTFGNILRLTSLDELPQLYNVLKGEMSLVGPRPLLLESIRPHERFRLSMRPGITGLAAVKGRQSLTWDERMELDRQYIDRWNLSLDFRILCETIPAALSQAHVYGDAGKNAEMKP